MYDPTSDNTRATRSTRNQTFKVTDNILVDCFAYGVKIMSHPQGDVCGNEVVLPDGETEDTVGPQRRLTSNARSCSF